MLKQIPLGDLEVPAPGEGVKGVADGLGVLDLRPEEPEAGLSPGFDGGVPSRCGGGSLIYSPISPAAYLRCCCLI
jgi:hypothetical protein